MFCVMPCLSGNNISIGFQGLVERFGGRLRGHMLIVPEETTRLSEIHPTTVLLVRYILDFPL